MNQFYENPKGKHVLIVGLGKSGIAAATVLKKLGFEVAVQEAKKADEMEPQMLSFLDNQNITCYFADEPKGLSRFHFIVLSPGVPPEVPFLEEARELGIKIISELELAYQLTDATFVAITGTNGKTTTTTLVGEMFREANLPSSVVGNIGVAVTTKAMDAPADSWLVTEVSSFQLEAIDEFHPKVSAILNLTPDHMDRHRSMEEYGRVKARIFENQTEDDFLVINHDDEGCFKLSRNAIAQVVPFSRKRTLAYGAFVQNGMLVFKDKNGAETTFCHQDELLIPGSHNLENALAALAVGMVAGICPENLTGTLRSFPGVEHRIELVDEIEGVRFVNDSKGTNPDAAIKAIEAMDGPVLLIAGGYDKGGEFDSLVAAFEEKVKAVLLLGKTAARIKEAAERAGYENTIILKDMDACVKEAFRLAKPGDTVLLSPACASWDMYDNYEQRGRHFKDCVAGLEK